MRGSDDVSSESRPPHGRLKHLESSFRPNRVSGTDRLRHHVSTLHQHPVWKVEERLDRVWQSEVLQGQRGAQG